MLFNKNKYCIGVGYLPVGYNVLTCLDNSMSSYCADFCIVMKMLFIKKLFLFIFLFLLLLLFFIINILCVKIFEMIKNHSIATLTEALTDQVCDFIIIAEIIA